VGVGGGNADGSGSCLRGTRTNQAWVGAGVGGRTTRSAERDGQERACKGAGNELKRG